MLFKAPTGTVSGDHAVYDVDTAVMVVTGRAHLRMVTPREVITARDSLEWYDTKQIGVARGDAVAVSADRRVRADILTALVDKAAERRLAYQPHRRQRQRGCDVAGADRARRRGRL